jgi:hypothetical protein
MIGSIFGSQTTRTRLPCGLSIRSATRMERGRGTARPRDYAALRAGDVPAWGPGSHEPPHLRERMGAPSGWYSQGEEQRPQNAGMTWFPRGWSGPELAQRVRVWPRSGPTSWRPELPPDASRAEVPQDMRRTPREIDQRLLEHHRAELPDPLDAGAVDLWGERGDWLRRRLADRPRRPNRSAGAK